MPNAQSPFESSREAYYTDDCQWLIDCYLPYLRRPGRRRYGGGGDGGGGGGPTVENVSIQSIDDGLWYRTGGVTVGPSDAIFWMTQVQTAAGANPELVIAEPVSGDKYKIQAWGTPPNVQWQVDTTPTGDAETPTQITVDGVLYDLVIRLDPGPIPVLEAV